MDSLSGDAVAERLRVLQVDTMTPIEALNALYELKKLVYPARRDRNAWKSSVFALQH